jgi:hypothetical protein
VIVREMDPSEREIMSLYARTSKAKGFTGFWPARAFVITSAFRKAEVITIPGRLMSAEELLGNVRVQYRRDTT